MEVTKRSNRNGNYLRQSFQNCCNQFSLKNGIGKGERGSFCGIRSHCG